MRAQKLGHAVLKVRSLALSVPFYRDVLGLTEVARYGTQMAFFSCGDNHHDLALLEVGAQAAPPMDNQVGLYHLAFKVGDSLDQLRAFRDHLAAHGVALAGQADHRVSQALYCHDPDGILIEVYVDADPAIWKDDPGAVAHVGMLRL
ncbi:MAG: VOC family protein [Thiobacillus sp.]|nr:VOC family protein [Thiobacillus sp.]MDP2057607.1 VOC family protein [Thiobacillus sp.]